jgi:hypothetical protein
VPGSTDASHEANRGASWPPGLTLGPPVCGYAHARLPGCLADQVTRAAACRTISRRLPFRGAKNGSRPLSWWTGRQIERLPGCSCYIGSVHGSRLGRRSSASSTRCITISLRISSSRAGGATEANDAFGGALAAGDFDQDGFADLAAGVSGEELGAGVVSVLFGSSGGLTRAGGQLFTQVGGAVEAIDRFGASLAAADYDHDGFLDLAAGAPFETVGSIPEAGAVSVLYGSGGGLTRVDGQLFTQNTLGVASSAEALDNFGLTLAAGALGPGSSAAPSGRRSGDVNTMPSG